MSAVLKQILAQKAIDVEQAKRQQPLSVVKAMMETAPPPRDFVAALRKSPKGARIIAECKQKSPSKGTLVSHYDPVAIARSYEKGGAAAISVLTDGPFFGGDLEHLLQVKENVGIPVLRKDFIIDEYQIYEARRYGADAFLLLSGVLDTAQLQYFLEIGRDLGMGTLIESHTREELEAALRTDAEVLGINNRNLTTMQVDFNNSLDLVKMARKSDVDRILVCESGINSKEQLKAAEKQGFSAFLIGEHLMTQKNPQQALLELI